jgi:hypothetical protein
VPPCGPFIDVYVCEEVVKILIYMLNIMYEGAIQNEKSLNAGAKAYRVIANEKTISTEQI